MKIVYIIHGTYHGAGMERTLTLKANYLADKFGHDVVIITTDQRKRPPYYPLSEKIQCIDLDINFDLYYDKPLAVSVLSFLRKQSLIKKKLSTLLHALNADIVISMMGRIISFLPKIKDGSKKIYEYHFNKYVRSLMLENASWLKKTAYQWRAWYELKNIKKMDAFVVLTHEDAAMWGNLKNIRVISNASSFFPKESTDSTQKVVISVGRFEHQKGYDRLVPVWQTIADKFPDWQLIVIGSGSKRSEIQAQIKQAGLEDSLILKDPVTDVEAELLKASIYLMTSRYEGFPMVLAEAMACSLPVVSFRCPCGPSDIIDHGQDGFLVDDEDVSQMSTYLSMLMEDEAFRKEAGMAARNNIQRYSQEAIMSLWKQLFNELTKSV